MSHITLLLLLLLVLLLSLLFVLSLLFSLSVVLLLLVLLLVLLLIVGDRLPYPPQLRIGEMGLNYTIHITIVNIHIIYFYYTIHIAPHTYYDRDI